MLYVQAPFKITPFLLLSSVALCDITAVKLSFYLYKKSSVSGKVKILAEGFYSQH